MFGHTFLNNAKVGRLGKFFMEGSWLRPRPIVAWFTASGWVGWAYGADT